jgi:diguanylate cyclase (GGDEF)-like protein
LREVTKTPPQPSADGVRVEEFLNQGRNVWIVRVVGGMLIVAAWVYFAVPHFGSVSFIADTLVFVGLGAFGVVAGYSARRNTISLEKRLRLTLIMRNMELESMATRDHLTHLFNRRHFFDRLERELQNAKGFQRPLSLLIIDVDRVREINDKHGHRVGDLVLASFGKFLLDQARASDLPARIGGDEFAVILPDTTEVAAQAAINRLLHALEKTSILETDNVDVKLTASIGASGFPWNAETEEEMLRKATASMEADKRTRPRHAATNGSSSDSDQDATAAAAASAAGPSDAPAGHSP